MRVLLVGALVAGCSQVAVAARPGDADLKAMGTDRPAVHGMLLVGSGPVYLSHLPMFHSPHNYQAIVEARLRKSGGDPEALYAKDRAASGTKVYTLVPEPFVLPDVINNRRSFKADIFRGHFERGGKEIATGISVDIARVIHFRKFDPKARRPDVLEYFCFGRPGEAFLAHKISVAPDFDQILEVSPASSFGAAELTQGAAVTFPGKADTVPLKEGETANGLVKDRAADLTARTDFYLETGDLAE